MLWFVTLQSALTWTLSSHPLNTNMCNAIVDSIWYRNITLATHHPLLKMCFTVKIDRIAPLVANPPTTTSTILPTNKNKKKKERYLFYTWHVTCDTWHMTHATRWEEVNLLSKFQLSSSYVLGVRGDMWQLTCDTWYMTHDTWHVTRDTWHVTRCARWTFSQNFGL